MKLSRRFRHKLRSVSKGPRKVREGEGDERQEKGEEERKRGEREREREREREKEREREREGETSLEPLATASENASLHIFF